MPPVKRKAQRRTPTVQVEGHQGQLGAAAQQQADRQAVDAQAGRQQGHGKHHAQVEDRRCQRRHREAPQRIEHRRGDAGHAQQPHQGRQQADQLCRQVQQGRVVLDKAAGQQVGKLGGQQQHQQRQQRQRNRGQRQQRPHQARKFALGAPGVVAEHGHQRRAQHTADQKIIDEDGNLCRHAVGADLPRRTKQRRNQHLAQQPQHAARQVAGSQHAGRPRQARGWFG